MRKCVGVSTLGVCINLYVYIIIHTYVVEFRNSVNQD